MKKHNFSAGPAILPKEAIKEAAKGVSNYNNSNLSILELSHRGPEFTEVIHETEQLVRELLSIPENYHVLFTTGGASTQFFMIPMNILGDDQTAYYIDTGTWSSKAIKEAQQFGEIKLLGSSEDKNYSYIPRVKAPKNGKYLHFTSNNTIYGTQFHRFPKGNGVPLVCDMSSDFLSRPIDVKDYGIIYAGAQKNLGPAGVTIVIIRKDLIGTIDRAIPTMLNYETFVKKNSMFNTPPVFPIYGSLLTLRWLKKKGGLAKMARLNKSKAKLLYNELDRNPLFSPNVAKKDRSLMNVTFKMTNEALVDKFLAETESNGLVGLKGHRSVGGFRASIYNAMPRSSVKVLVELMEDFSKKYG